VVAMLSPNNTQPPLGQFKVILTNGKLNRDLTNKLYNETIQPGEVGFYEWPNLNYKDMFTSQPFFQVMSSSACSTFVAYTSFCQTDRIAGPCNYPPVAAENSKLESIITGNHSGQFYQIGLPYIASGPATYRIIVALQNNGTGPCHFNILGYLLNAIDLPAAHGIQSTIEGQKYQLFKVINPKDPTPLNATVYVTPDSNRSPIGLYITPTSLSTSAVTIFTAKMQNVSTGMTSLSFSFPFPWLYVGIYNFGSEDAKFSISNTITGPPDNNTTRIISIVFGVFGSIVIVVIFVVLFVIFRRRKSEYMPVQ